MSKGPSKSRIPTFSSKPGKFRFIPNTRNFEPDDPPLQQKSPVTESTKFGYGSIKPDFNVTYKQANKTVTIENKNETYAVRDMEKEGTYILEEKCDVVLSDQKCPSGPYSLIGIELCRANETYNIQELTDQGLVINPDTVSNKRLTQVIDDDFTHKRNKNRNSFVSGSCFDTNRHRREDESIAFSTPIVERIKRKNVDGSTFSISPLSLDGSILNTSKKANVSPVETPSCPKQNSFEMDESLGILTPNQMKEFSQFVANTKTPSSDDLKSLLTSKISDKTLSTSRTPSSENLGSLPHDGFKLPSTTTTMTESIEEKFVNLPKRSSNLWEVTCPLNSEIIERTPVRPDTIQLQPNEPNKIDISSPNLAENSTTDFSLGLINEDMLVSGSNLESTSNLDLPLYPINLDGKMEVFQSISRSDQTPSPEDLPLDPIDPKMNLLDPNFTEKPKTATKTNSFITSITSITSLDTGYQGDGEMSRPASRGADHSPIAHKPNNAAAVNLNWQRAMRRQDPMTDSDFFTESDADVHDEVASKGDRRAQVIDGTLYGANAQAAPAADIYIQNHEEMDSSGIFTDLDTNPRTDDFSDGERHKDIADDDKSPSDASTKTISENSQELKDTPLDKTLVNETENQEILDKTMVEKIKSPTLSVTSTPGSRKSPRTRTPLPKEESPNKKIKMPKRNVQSKVKTMMENKTEEQEHKPRKTVIKTNRWDAVMNKISKGQDDKSKIRLNQIKSKVSTGIAGGNNKRTDNVKNEEATKPKVRRFHANITRNTSSIHSSISDLSVGTTAKTAAKKREVTRCPGAPVTEVLTRAGTKPLASNRSPSSQHKSNITRELKKSPGQLHAEGKSAAGRRTLSRPATGAAVGAKTTPNKDQSRVTGSPPHKGGSPVRPQLLPERPPTEKYLPQVKHSAKGVEALGVLVQYLVFNLDAFRTPALKRELEQLKTRWLKDTLELEETRMGYRRLEDALSEQKQLAAAAIDQERNHYRAEIAELFEKHRRDIAELNERNLQERLELQSRYQEENTDLKSQLDDELVNRENEIRLRIEAYSDEQRYKFQELELKNERLRQEHQIALEILREENDSIRNELDDKASLTSDLEELRILNEKLKHEFCDKERLYEEKLSAAEDEISLLKEENRKILETFKSDTKDNKLQNGLDRSDSSNSVGQAALGRCTQLQDEVESLRSVLDLKLAELSELRRAHGELAQAAEELPGAVHRCQTLQARLEDLEMQLARKTEFELQLTKENKRLVETCSQETKQKKRLTLYNEELQWKLKQNSEVVNAILQAPNLSLSDEVQNKSSSSGYLSRSLHTSSFNEKHYGTPHVFERTLSFRERSSQFYKDDQSKSSGEKFSSKLSEYFDLEDSPPSSPKVKGVVDKGDSVSWVLDMDESPEVLASRMVRRAGSFRNVTPVKSTPTKSPATKRPRTKSNNLSLSASAGAIVSPKSDNRHRSKSVTLRDTQSENQEFLSNSWHYTLCTSTPTKGNSIRLENNPDLEHDTDVAMSLPALPSEIKKELPNLPSGDRMIFSPFPKNSAGEAMISESNSEDECSSSTGERSPSVSDTETSEEPTGSTEY